MNRAVFRIIDANFNRAREGIRLIEEFCRFAFDCQSLTSRCKNLRHQLSSAVLALDSKRLIASRDTVGDVGCELKVPAQPSRKTAQDCSNAAFGRLTEALRVLSELAATLDSEVAGQLEQIRYDSYTLQKDFNIIAIPRKRFKDVKLYCIIGPNFEKSPLELAKACAKGGADALQLRIPPGSMSDRDCCRVAADFVDICREANVLSIINNRCDIACATEADGVHLGQDDMPVEKAREFQLKPLIIGKSTHNLAELHEAISQNPTYIATGAVFASSTKPDVITLTSEYIKQAGEILRKESIQHIAIGGITLENLKQLSQMPIDGVAVSSFVCDCSDPEQTCKKLKAILTEHQ